MLYLEASFLLEGKKEKNQMELIFTKWMSALSL
jgi:hypothetical protein